MNPMVEPWTLVSQVDPQGVKLSGPYSIITANSVQLTRRGI